MKRIESLRDYAHDNLKTIVLPEGDDERVVKAASIIDKERIAKVILLGKRPEIESAAKRNSCNLENIELIEPGSYAGDNEIISTFYGLRKHKGLTEEQARALLLKNWVYFGAVMTRLGMADGFVAGASHTTTTVAKASIYCLKIDSDVGIVSSGFLMGVDDCPFGEDGLFVFGDCGIIPDPSARQLCGIAISCGALMEGLFRVKARVALLSYSTKGSARGGSIDKVKEALKLIRAKAPDMAVDGELQADAALVPEVATIKCGNSNVAGKANVLVFPNLDAGNICYKITQRLGKARAVGPILLGLTKPASDLSRGCGVDEIVDAVAVTAIRARQNKE